MNSGEQGQDGGVTISPGRRQAAGSAKNSRPARAPVKVVEDAHALVTWLVQRVAGFPKDVRHTVGHRLVERGLDLIELLVTASYTPAPQRGAVLGEANLLIERLRHLVRLGDSVRALSHEQYGFAVTQLLDIGRQVGGWAKMSAGA